MAGDTSVRQPPHTPFSHPLLSRHRFLAGGNDLLALTAQLAAWMVLPSTRTIARSLLEDGDAVLAKGCEYFLRDKSYDMTVPVDWRTRHLESFFPDVIHRETMMTGIPITNPVSRRGTIVAALQHWRRTCEELRTRLEIPSSFRSYRDPWIALAGVLTLVHVDPDEQISTDEATPNHRDKSPTLRGAEVLNADKISGLETPKRSRAINLEDDNDPSERHPKKKRCTTESPTLDNIHTEQCPPRLTSTPIRLLHHRSEEEDKVFVPGLHNAASVCYPTFSMTGVSTVVSIAPNTNEFVILTTRDEQRHESLEKFKLRSLEKELTLCRRQLDQEQTLRKKCENDKAELFRRCESLKMDFLRKQDRAAKEGEDEKDKLRRLLTNLAGQI